MGRFAAGCGVCDRNCAESSSGAGCSSLQETAEHSGEGKNILYHLMNKLQGKTLIHHQGIICVVVFGRSSLRRIVHTAQSSLLVA
jgi:hypothetical protein